MSMNRAGFLKSLALGAGGLIVGEQVLEAWDRLTWKRTMFPSAGIPSAQITRLVLQKPYGIDDAYLLTVITIGTTRFNAGAIMVPAGTSIETETKDGRGVVSIDGKPLISAPCPNGQFSFQYESFPSRMFDTHWAPIVSPLT